MSRSADLQHTIYSQSILKWGRCEPMWPCTRFEQRNGLPAPCLLILRQWRLAFSSDALVFQGQGRLPITLVPSAAW